MNEAISHTVGSESPRFAVQDSAGQQHDLETYMAEGKTVIPVSYTHLTLPTTPYV